MEVIILNHNQHGWKNEVIYFIAATTIWSHTIYLYLVEHESIHEY